MGELKPDGEKGQLRFFFTSTHTSRPIRSPADLTHESLRNAWPPIAQTLPLPPYDRTQPSLSHSHHEYEADSIAEEISSVRPNH